MTFFADIFNGIHSTDLQLTVLLLFAFLMECSMNILQGV